MLSKLLHKQIQGASKTYHSRGPKKVLNVHQRRKLYSNDPKFKLKTLIRPPDLIDPNLNFPIKINIRYRHELNLIPAKKRLKEFMGDSSKIQWKHLRPNQILLAFQNIQYLSWNQIVEGLKALSQVHDQNKYDWNNHEWVKKALDYVRDNMDRIKKVDTMNFYNLMKRLRYNDPVFWQKIYTKIEENMYDLYPSQIEYLYLTYYNAIPAGFSPNFKQNIHKLMKNRLRQFKPEAIVVIFQQFLQAKALDNYWLENVFISLFKDQQYIYNANHIGRIFRAMMIVGHENNQRFYDNLYNRIRNIQYRSQDEIDKLVDVLEEVKEIFVSHRVQSVLQFLKDKRILVVEKKKQMSKKTLVQIVQDDLKFFLEKRKLKNQDNLNLNSKDEDNTNTKAAGVV